MDTEKKLIMFDFDGVLAHTLSHAYTVHKNLNTHFTWEEFANMSDGNFHDGYQKKLEQGNHKHPEGFPEIYNQNLQTLSLEEELALLVKKLSKKYILYIVSSSRDPYIEKFLEKEGVVHSFTGILGYDTHSRKVPKIQSILEKEKIPPDRCLFVTDTIGDVKEAKECGVSSVGVTWGLHEKEKLQKEGVFAVVETPEKLDQKIGEFFANM